MADPRVAVITPYHREPIAMIAQAHRSVIDQDVPADHFLIADGHPQPEIDRWTAQHVTLPQAHDDNGSTPRGIGSLLARNAGYDFIAFLDADNWYHPGHLRSMIALWEQTRHPVITCMRTFHDAAGNDLRISEADEDALHHVDTSAMLIHRSGFASLPVWLDMPKILSSISDRVFLAGLAHHRLAVASTRARTVAFRSRYRIHYQLAGAAMPAGLKDAETMAPAYAWLATAEGVSACIATLGFWPATYLNR